MTAGLAAPRGDAHCGSCAGVIRLALVLLLSFASALVAAPAALAVQPDEVLADPALEARARDISEGLRCLVCQNQSIDDSAAPLARDLRLLVRERLTAGDSDDGVRSYLVERYGGFILLKPPFQPQTLLLWLTPALVLLAGGIIALTRLRRPVGAAKTLSSDEEEALARILREDQAAEP